MALEGFNHIVWEGRHKVLLPSIVQNTPEVADDQVFTEVVGPFCATPGCSCNLRKLSDLALAGRGLPGVGEDADAVARARR